MSTEPALPRHFPGRPSEPAPGFVPGTIARRTESSKGRVRTGRWWMVQAVSGSLLVGFLGLHLFAQHFLAPDGLRDFAAVVDYLRQPLAIVAELGLLVVVVIHAGLGARTHFVEYYAGGPAVARASILIGLVGLGIVGYAAWLTYRIATWQP